jgi:hypothetical protein
MSDDSDREYERATRERERIPSLLDRTISALRAEEENVGDGGCEILARHLDAAREFLPLPDDEIIRDIVGRFEHACRVARENLLTLEGMGLSPEQAEKVREKFLELWRER